MSAGFSQLLATNRDIDVVESDRPAIFQHIISRFGADRTARVAAFGTIQAKGVIDDVGRHLAKKWAVSHPNKSPDDNPWSLKRSASIKQEFDGNPELAKQKYPEIFYYHILVLSFRSSDKWNHGWLFPLNTMSLRVLLIVAYSWPCPFMAE